MENALQVFAHEEFGEIRTLGDWENPEFCLVDLCRVLELDPSQVMKRLDDGVVTVRPLPDSLGRIQMTNFVNEDGLYDVILDSRKPQAKKFRKWITSEVIPAIRRAGFYTISQIVNQLVKSAKETKFLPDLKCVYAFEMSNDTVKIGYTKNIRQRMQTISSGSGLEILNGYATEFVDSEIAYQIEQACHETFDAYRVKGEFFRISFKEACAELNKYAEIISEINKKITIAL